MKIIATILALVFVTSGALYDLSSPEPSRSALAHGDGHQGHMGHDHDHQVSMPEGAPSPRIVIDALPDPVGGWNVHLMTSNFQFAPEQASRAHVPGEGHAHLFVNGEKIARVYGPWFHVPHMSPGENQVTVTLNTNDHATYAADGAPVTATVLVHVDASQ